MPDTLETRIASIWEEILGVQAVASEQDFFELGGTSLHAARVVTKTRAAFGVKLSAQTLFDNSTLGGFAAQVGSAHVPKVRA
jgi:acyl carrier protein